MSAFAYRAWGAELAASLVQVGRMLGWFRKSINQCSHHSPSTVVGGLRRFLSERNGRFPLLPAAM
ncbi:MAG: hypothetical protein GPOALKHO_001553 [Sodalis sp.]|nr:MAG: hypothetical protein GPOALKHO_001553 [Sodalis sp.]